MRQFSRRPARQYAAIPNAAMRDSRISIEARGLLALMMTYSDSWVFAVDHLRTVTGVGRDKLRNMLRELGEAGYLLREAMANEDGRFDGSRWIIVDDPTEAGRFGSGEGSPEQDVPDTAKTPENPRPPENPAVGVTDPLKIRPPENPTAGESAPIRKPKDKKTKSKNPLTPADAGEGVREWGDSFQEFWGAYPDPVEREAAWREYQLVLEAGEITPEALTETARQYAKSRHVEKGYGKKPANWLASGAWREEWEVGRKAKADAQLVAGVDVDALARQFAPAVLAGRSYAAAAIKPDVARRMVALGLVTGDQLRRVGVAVRMD